jgi:fumarylacetoacetate (FAA) hydrolase
VTLANDVTCRSLVPAELEKGFGFFCSKPATAFAPFAVTPDELGPAYREGRIHLPLRVSLNGAVVGEIDAGAPMHFSFFDLIEHITKTRAFTAGTILGGGTVSTADVSHGVSCLAELRMREKLETGAVKTPFLKVGDRVRIEMMDLDGVSMFGSIDQEVVAS